MPLLSVFAVTTTLCMTTEMHIRTRDLMLKGINDALTRHTMHLYDNLLKDRGNGDRMLRGMRNAVILYVKTYDDLMKWKPPICNGENR